jgi:hypothetical protein
MHINIIDDTLQLGHVLNEMRSNSLKTHSWLYTNYGGYEKELDDYKKKYRGMSTKAVQRSWGKTKLVTAEGITKFQKVEYSLNQWTENFEDYLRSAMSYCNAKHLDEFIVVGDLKATETNMIEFVESGVETFIRELVSMMNNEEPETTPNV